MQIKIVFAGLMALVCTLPASAQTAERAGGQHKLAAKPDGLGTVLPAGLTAQQLVALIAPGRDPALATLVGAKAWPHRANTYVAIACFVRSKAERAKISATQTAIGARAGWSERYTGVGMGSFEALSLFRIDGGKLVNILSEPIAFETDSNDGYDADGNRKGIVREGRNVLTILPGNTGGYHDLQLKTLKGRWKKTFVWDSATSRYMPAPAPKQR
ncbi:hypothetical protein INH39_24585 [Massilia violaceinigra]|uniref:Uncharacterized protein n=1 Tax=Massilia violaceinigra TaxID=2045208 RepID=A0ABY4A2I5_9BURK|nr:hypothetical protein [Massilia violaceinigra]UOD28597.1 hypothetical protein INH39_24585 [Massilia violaceinigra]